VIVKKATSTIPIVGITLGDPVRLGLIASLARPGGNVTGLAYSVGVQTIVKALEPLREAVPRVHRVAILSNPANPYHVFAVGEVKRAAESLGVQLQFLEAKSPAHFGSAFNEMANQRAGALIFVPDSMFQFHRTRLADLAARGRLPATSVYEGGPTRRWLKVKQKDWTVAEDGWRRRISVVAAGSLIAGLFPRLPEASALRYALDGELLTELDAFFTD
jgi:ABC transporter substrate binding protein